MHNTFTNIHENLTKIPKSNISNILEDNGKQGSSMCNIRENIGKIQEIQSILHLCFLFGSLTTAQHLLKTTKIPQKSPHSYRLMPGFTFYCHVVGPSPGPVARRRHGTFPGHQAPPPNAPRGEKNAGGETPHSDNIAAALKGRLNGS